MKQRRFFRGPLFIIMVSLFFLACQKGPVGPQGPVGLQGPKGNTGSPNVIYSAWNGFVAGNWAAAASEFGKLTRLYTAAAPDLTQVIIDSGVVMVYVKFASAADPQLLPLLFYDLTQPENQYLGMRLSVGNVIINFYDVDDNNDPGTFTGNNAYRYIIIPGGVPSGNSIPKDYKTLCQMYNIPEN